MAKNGKLDTELTPIGSLYRAWREPKSGRVAVLIQDGSKTRCKTRQPLCFKFLIRTSTLSWFLTSRAQINNQYYGNNNATFGRVPFAFKIRLDVQFGLKYTYSEPNTSWGSTEDWVQCIKLADSIER